MSQGAVAACCGARRPRRGARPRSTRASAFFGAPVQVCSGGVGNNNFYGKGLVNALAAATS
jgi:hypothetical protein